MRLKSLLQESPGHEDIKRQTNADVIRMSHHCVNPKVPAVQINSGPAVGYQWAEKRRDSLSLTEDVWRFTSSEVISDLHFTSFHRFGSVYFNKSNVFFYFTQTPRTVFFAVKRDCLAYIMLFITIFRFGNYAVWLSLTVKWFMNGWRLGSDELPF